MCHFRVSHLVTWPSSILSGGNWQSPSSPCHCYSLPASGHRCSAAPGRPSFIYFFIFQENPRLLFSSRLSLQRFRLKCLRYIMPVTVARMNCRGPSRCHSSQLIFLSPAPLLMNTFAPMNTATQVFPASSIKLFNALFETRRRTATVIAVLLDP